MFDSIGIVIPALVTGLLVLSTHVPLGDLVLDRGIVFIDIAIAQVAALGVVAGHALLGGEVQGLAAQVSAATAALACALFLAWSERHAGKSQEALIGVVFVVAASAQIIILGFDPHGAEHLNDLLVGQILWVDYHELVGVAALYMVILAACLWANLEQRRVGFYVVFAPAITASVQLVGVFLVFASLIVPALAARPIKDRPRRILAAYGLGGAGYVLGIFASLATDAPTGAAIVCALALVCAGAWAGRRITATA